MTPAVLIVEDERILGDAIAAYLGRHGFEPTVVDSAEAALEHVAGADVDLVVLDHHLPGMDGVEALGRIKQALPGLEVVMLTAHGSVKAAVAAMRAGAFEYLTKPVDLEELALVLGRAAEHARLRRELRYWQETGRPGDPRGRIVGASAATEQLRAQVERLAAIEGAPPLLITGETGTGKGLVARTIHDLGPRGERPFVELNCAAIPTTLLESEIFGHERGAFTDARSAKPGLFEAADRGTLFLDEIGAMPLDVQVKLLKVIEEKSVRRLGAVRARGVDVRIVAATNVDLDAATQRGEFRADLLYRLKVLTLTLTPLRERRDDILPLARVAIERSGRTYHRPKRLTAEAEARLLEHPWPGNVRELANLMERVVLLHDGDTIGAEDLGLPGPPLVPATPPAVNGGRITVDFSQGGVSLPRLERTLIVEALRASGGHRRRAAELLDISVETLRYRLEKHGLVSAGRRPGPFPGDAGTRGGD
jgi:two-component system response regulator AtoC